MDELTDIVVFVRVVDAKSFTAAAERLGIAKSVVSKYVSRLEERLGARLLNLTTRRDDRFVDVIEEGYDVTLRNHQRASRFDPVGSRPGGRAGSRLR